MLISLDETLRFHVRTVNLVTRIVDRVILGAMIEPALSQIPSDVPALSNVPQLTQDVPTFITQEHRCSKISCHRHKLVLVVSRVG